MNLPIYQADAFTDQLFKGNPAAIVPLESWLPRETMQAIAAENNLAETAFFVATDDAFDLKWFTPTVEIDLCGHATLASARILYDFLGYTDDEIRFDTNSGRLTVQREGDLLTLNFPANPPAPAPVPDGLLEGLGIENLVEVLKGRTNDYVVVVENQSIVADLKPDFRLLKTIAARGIMVTAPGDADTPVDFVSRFFGPASGIDEDPVTGSAHTVLAPYWAAKLGKTSLTARQISPRSGDLWLQLLGDRVTISGKVVVYLKGEIFV